ncbi:hypothetical protein [Lunatibacter salilacus]|uniref:hypothetical protein n=1 Tax=Lunatibacter salilacus TaxID=2483804 RepID=UPI00131E9DC6|nr:hypothetical protein [Lunatibacter salilacus]
MKIAPSKLPIQVGLMLLLLVSCSKTEQAPPENPTQLNKYFPMVQFVQDQIPQLDGREVSKKLTIKGKEEALTMVMNAEGWRKELDLFIQADINKNSLATSYATQENAQLLQHTLIPGEKGDIQQMKIHRSGDKISRIDFSFKKENLFYLSEGSGSLEMTADGKHLSSYEVNGYQKVWFLPANIMSTEGKINYLP